MEPRSPGAGLFIIVLIRLMVTLLAGVVVDVMQQARPSGRTVAVVSAITSTVDSLAHGTCAVMLLFSGSAYLARWGWAAICTWASGGVAALVSAIVGPGSAPRITGLAVGARATGAAALVLLRAGPFLALQPGARVVHVLSPTSLGAATAVWGSCPQLILLSGLAVSSAMNLDDSDSTRVWRPREELSSPVAAACVASAVAASVVVIGPLASSGVRRLAPSSFWAEAWLLRAGYLLDVWARALAWGVFLNVVGPLVALGVAFGMALGWFAFLVCTGGTDPKPGPARTLAVAAAIVLSPQLAASGDWPRGARQLGLLFTLVTHVALIAVAAALAEGAALQRELFRVLIAVGAGGLLAALVTAGFLEQVEGRRLGRSDSEWLPRYQQL